MKFAALDFETATSSRNSACALGAVFFEVDEYERVWRFGDLFYELIQPPGNIFDFWNVGIHGITPEMTEDADSFDVVWRRFENLLEDHVLLAHNAAFDMSVARNSGDFHSFQMSGFRYLCTYRMAKAAFPTLFSYRLDVLSEHFGLDLEEHHHAGWDALASAQLAAKICEATDVLDPVAASEKLGFRLGQIEGNSYSPFSGSEGISARSGESIRFRDLVPSGKVDESHPAFGLTFAFTGTLASMSRKDAAQMVTDCGGIAHSSPGKKTNFLVVGVTDFTKVRDGMSGKMKKALDLADSGTGIEIIDEAAFLQMFVTSSQESESQGIVCET